MKLFICGFARHGKDTVAEILREEFGLRFNSSSRIAMRTFLRDDLRTRYGLVYETEDDCYNDRINHRSEWFDVIADYNRDDPARLSKLIFSENDAYVGIRSLKELQASMDQGLADIVLWIDASDRVSPEPITSNTITANDCDVTIHNNGTVEELRTKIRRLFSLCHLTI